jgi:hypothetical protein
MLKTISRKKPKEREVRLLKKLLKKVGFKDIIIDESFDYETEKYIIEFQKKNRIKASGIIKDKTWGALMKEGLNIEYRQFYKLELGGRIQYYILKIPRNDYKTDILKELFPNGKHKYIDLRNFDRDIKINATFFKDSYDKQGKMWISPTGYTKIDGRFSNYGGFPLYQLCVDTGEIGLLEDKKNNMEKKCNNIISGTPLLVYKGKKSSSFETHIEEISKRNPRMSYGNNDKFHIIVVADGREKMIRRTGAYYSTIADFFIKEKAERAIGLDGGKSAQLWILNELISESWSQRSIAVGLGWNQITQNQP